MRFPAVNPDAVAQAEEAAAEEPEVPPWEEAA